MKYLLPFAAVISMASAPAFAAAPQVDRTAAPTQQSAQLGGGASATAFIIGLIGLAAFIAAIARLSNSNSKPNSPG